MLTGAPKPIRPVVSGLARRRYVTGGVFPKARATYYGVSVRTKGMGSLGREPYRRRKPLISPLSLIRLNCSDIGADMALPFAVAVTAWFSAWKASQ